MKKMSYAEQLRHPNWQRKRLQMLEGANWTCQMCGAKEDTLHVHHKQYFKGRMAWEYAPAELLVLCETCHQYEHDLDDALKLLLARAEYPTPLTPVGVGLMAGYIHGSGRLDVDLKDIASAFAPEYFQLGILVHLCAIQGRRKILEALAGFDIDPANQAHKQLIEWLEEGTKQE